MFLECVLFFVLGICAGTFTGLMPGIHINLIATISVSLVSSYFFKLPPVYLAIFIVSMSITHVFIDFIPSIFLGAPEDGSELSVLPGHEMLQKGLGLEAVSLTSLGCLYGVFAFLVAIIPLYFIAPRINALPLFQKAIPLFLILICLNLVFIENNRLKGLFVFLISGTLGFMVLNMNLKEPLLPLLTGLFGTASIILSLDSKINLKDQKKSKKIEIEKLKPVMVASFFAPLSIFLPALSGGQIATIGNQFAKLNKRGFLFLLGTIGTLTMSFSFLALFLINKTRTGSAAAIQDLLPQFELGQFTIIVATIVLTAISAFFLSSFLSGKFIKLLSKVEYRKISVSTLAIISIITLLVSGPLGLLVLGTSTLTGIYCINQGTNRIAMMGSLLLPTIILYLF